MAGGPGQRLTLCVAAAFGLTAVGILALRPSDRLLAVERWAPQILSAAAEAGLEDPYWFAGLVYVESKGDPEVRSSIGALGLCQLLPGTAAELAERYDVAGPPYTPADNLRLGARYLAAQLRRFGGDRDLALLAYRLGPEAVRRESAAAGGVTAWKAQLRLGKPGPWEYRTQVLRVGDRFRERAAALPARWAVP
ncbi:MAG TPA: transglycosylase SLT domain-containing protein [Planctomycetota bacterium]